MLTNTATWMFQSLKCLIRTAEPSASLQQNNLLGVPLHHRPLFGSLRWPLWFPDQRFSCLLPQVLSQLFCICLHTFTSRHQPAHTYETGGASGWVNMYSVLSHTPALSHQHTQSALPALHPPKHSPIGWDAHQLRMNEQVSMLWDACFSNLVKRVKQEV